VSSISKLVIPFLPQHDILEINDIFRDLGRMVFEQGDLIG